MTIEYAALTRRGHDRTENEDRISVDGRVMGEGLTQGSVTDRLLAVVCDGAGDGGLGARAALLSCEGFVALDDMSNPPLSICDQIRVVDESLRNESRVMGIDNRMASTIAGVYLDDAESVVFNVGDSRVYQIDDYGIRQLSDDHTRAQSMVEASFARTADELPAKTRRTITRFLGGGEMCRPSISILPPMGVGAKLIICSDGACRVLGSKGLADVAASRQDPLRCCRLIYDLARAGGEGDDISVIVIERAC